MIKLFKKKLNGVSTFEFVLVLPVLLVVFLLLFFVVCFVISYCNYGSCASNIAGSMNFRQTGYSIIQNMDVPSKITDDHENSLDFNNNTFTTTISKVGQGQQHVSNNCDIKINGEELSNDNLNKKALIYFANQNRNQFFFPFCKVEGVEMSVFRMNEEGHPVKISLPNNLNETDASKYSNSIVKVSITYSFCDLSIAGINIPGVKTTAGSYSVLT